MQIKFQGGKISLTYDSNYSLAISFFKITEIDLKEAQRFFAQKFSCGASVTGEDEIIIQGDFTDDIIDVIQEKWPEVSIWNMCIYRNKLLKQVPSVLVDNHNSWNVIIFILQVDDDSIEDLGEVKKWFWKFVCI